MNSEFTSEIQRPASEVEQLLARVRRCLSAQEVAGFEEQLGRIRAGIAANTGARGASDSRGAAAGH